MNQYDRLKKIIRRLRSPRGGCPWDRKQTHRSFLPYFYSELDEFALALKKNDRESMKEELGDVLLQIFMHAQIASEENSFNIDNVFNSISTKLMRRHPHVFGKTKVSSVKDVIDNWEKIKKKEKHRIK